MMENFPDFFHAEVLTSSLATHIKQSALCKHIYYFIDLNLTILTKIKCIKKLFQFLKFILQDFVVL
jgi:hypothetical protein